MTGTQAGRSGPAERSGPVFACFLGRAGPSGGQALKSGYSRRSCKFYFRSGGEDLPGGTGLFYNKIAVGGYFRLKLGPGAADTDFKDGGQVFDRPGAGRGRRGWFPHQGGWAV